MKNPNFTKKDRKRGGGAEKEKTNKKQGNCKTARTINKMVLESPYLSIITLNINGLNSPIKMYNGSKMKTQQHAAYRRLILVLRTHISYLFCPQFFLL